MAPEFNNTYIPERYAEVFRKFVSGIPGARLGREGLSIDEFSQRITEVLVKLNPDEVKVIDLDIAKNQWAQSSRKLSGLNPQAPTEWGEFYNSLDLREKALLGRVFRPLIETGFAHSTLTEMNRQVLRAELFHRVSSSMQLAENIFGVRFETDQEPN